MLLKFVETNNKLLTFLMSRKFCERTHDDSKLENISHK